MAHFGEMDARARDLIGDDETVPASDLIFTDGLELTDTAHAEIDAALIIERAARADALRASRTRRTAGLVAVAGAGLLFLLLLVPATEAAAPAKTSQESVSVLLGATAMSDLRLDAGSGSAQADRESSSNDAAGEGRIEEAEAGPKASPMRPPTPRSSTARIPRRISLPWRRSAPISGAYPTASSCPRCSSGRPASLARRGSLYGYATDRANVSGPSRRTGILRRRSARWATCPATATTPPRPRFGLPGCR